MSTSGLTPAELAVVGLLLAMIIVGLAVMIRWPSQPSQPSADGDFSGGTLAQQAAEWDRRLASVPQHADLRSISERLHTVEQTCAVVRAELGGVKDVVNRVEKTTNLLLGQQLQPKN